MTKIRRKPAPVAVFAYNRPQHLFKTLDHLNKNVLAEETDLFIFLDGPRTDDDKDKVNQCKEVIENFDWKGEKKEIISREKNYGLAENIVQGVTQIINRYGRIIVLEDDILTSVGFLKYMNDALDFYEKVSEVMHIAGYMHPIKLSDKQDTYFYQVTSCWGWATWTDRWKELNLNPNELYAELKEKNLLEWFDLDNSRLFISQLRRNMSGELKSWAIKWQATVNLKQGLSLHPRKSLVRNIGFDDSGENCRNDQFLINQELIDFIEVTTIPLQYSSSLRTKMKKYYSGRPSLRGLVTRIKNRANRHRPGKENWHRIKSGVARGKYLFLNPKAFHAWQEMILGKYDSFWIDRVKELDIKVGCILDVGAHFGYHTITLAALFENARIASIEPNPVNVARLRMNVERNELHQVTIHPIALSDELGELEFSVSDNVESSQSTGSYLSKVKPPLSDEHYTTFKATKVKSQTLDDLCEKNGYEPDLIKIDVEGAEILTLTGASKTIKSFKPVLFIEAHSLTLEKQAVSFLSDYKIEILDRDGDRSFLFCLPN